MKFSFKKFLSRKFLIAIVGMIVGLAVSLGADASEIQQIAGAVVSAVSAMSYIFGEAMVDSAAVTVKEDENVEEEAISINSRDDEGTDWK